jgi:hypothetical protein
MDFARAMIAQEVIQPVESLRDVLIAHLVNQIQAFAGMGMKETQTVRLHPWIRSRREPAAGQNKARTIQPTTHW